jgi:hypothetical protein
MEIIDKDWIFKEDENGDRYRERIMDVIMKEIGVEGWFRLKGYPINPESVWKNRYTGSLITLNEDIHRFDNEFRTSNLESKGYFLWENNLPIEIWNEDLNKKAGQQNLFEEVEKSKEIKEKEQKLNQIEEFKGDKKVIVKVKYGLSRYEGKRDFFVSDNRREVGIQSYLGGIGSSAYTGSKNKTLEEAEEDAVEWLIKDILGAGVKRENIEIIKEEMTENELKAWKEDKAKWVAREKDYLMKDISKLRKELSEKTNKFIELENEK